jgi:hypothetical protein
MTLKIETLALNAEQISRETALYVRNFFENILVNQQEFLAISVVVLCIAAALKSFNSEDTTLLSSLLRVVGFVILWTSLICSVLFLLIATSGITFDLVLQHDSLFEFYKFYIWQFLLNAKLPTLIGLFLGMLAYVFIKRFVEPYMSQLILLGAKRNIEIDTVPDVQNMQNILPETSAYDARKYFKIARKKQAVFLGIDSNNKPVFVPRSHWNKSNVQIVGVPGAGKGISAAIQLYQSILNDDACVVINPKIDEWAESLYADACKNIGKPLIVIDCRPGSPPQINPLMGINSHELNELLVAVFNLSRQGEAADFYRNNDRKGARLLSKLADKNSLLSIPTLLSHSHAALGDFYKNCEGLITQIEEISELSTIQTNEGLDLDEFIKSGGCLLLQGSTRDESVITLLNMLLVRIIQISEKRDDKSRHVSIFCDELKFITTSTLLASLGNGRDKGINFLLAHQTLADLEAENAGFSPLAVRNAILSLTPIKWVYQCSDYDTAKWVSQLCGTKTGIAEVIEATSNSLAAENVGLDRRFQTTEIPNIHTNIIQNLPPFCAVCIGANDTGSVLAFTSPIRVPKVSVPLCPAPPLDIEEFGDDLL